jgi:hypothetical protein
VFRRLLVVWLFSIAYLSGALEGRDGRYLLVFKAYPPDEKKERNFCDLAVRIEGFLDHHGPLRENYGADTIVSGRVRYGVRSVFQVGTVSTSTFEKSPESLSDGVYVLVYDSIYKICARRYRISSDKIEGAPNSVRS